MAGIKLGGLLPNGHCKNIGGWRFGTVQYCMVALIHTEEILVDFNLAVVKWDRQTAKFSGYTVYSMLTLFVYQ